MTGKLHNEADAEKVPHDACMSIPFSVITASLVRYLDHRPNGVYSTQSMCHKGVAEFKTISSSNSKKVAAWSISL